jgi:hypothetical protein
MNYNWRQPGYESVRLEELACEARRRVAANAQSGMIEFQPKWTEKMDDELDRAKQDEINAVTFSFNISRLKEDVTFSGDTVPTVIRAHLYLEHVVMQTLTEAFQLPDVVDFRRMSFLAKLDLCVGLGIYPRAWREIVGRVNDMRNRAAQKLDAQVSEHAKRELWELLPERAKQSLRSKYADDTAQWPMPLARVFHAIVVWCDIFRQAAKRQRIEMKYAALAADRVIHPLEDEETVEAAASQKALELIYSPTATGEGPIAGASDSDGGVIEASAVEISDRADG